MSVIKLFVDDTRAFPEKGFECVSDYDGAIFMLRHFDFEFISLDYSLGGSQDGLDILKYIHSHKKYPKHLNIHSNHITGREEMRKYAEQNFPGDVLITTNMLDK